MKTTAAIDFDEFNQCTTYSGEEDNYTLTIREHPEFGKWQEKNLDLSHIRLTEHKVSLSQEIRVNINDETLTDRVNHCMCIDGTLGAHFNQQDLRAELKPGTYHYLSVEADEYGLLMSRNFHNIHIEVSREYYAGLLCEAEDWSASLKGNILKKDVLYPGEFSLTPEMIQSIYGMFSSPVSGSLKWLLAEAKVHELVALQLSAALTQPRAGKSRQRNRELLNSIREYLDRSFLEAHSLKGLCQRFGINEFALKHGFKENFHTTVFDYILSKRLEYGRDLLLDTDATIQIVSTKVGYKYPNHFSTAFKHKFGISPGKLLAGR